MHLDVMERIYKQIKIVAGCALLFTTQATFGQSGIVVTKRSAPIGLVSFSSESTVSGISDAKHIDGYVKKNGGANFVFPVGDNNVYRPFAAAADGITGAYFLENPNGAGVPSGGPFSVSQKENSVETVSAREFWDIDGANPTRITLTWNAASGISLLTGGVLDVLTIVGWNTGSSRWEKISSNVDQAALLGGSSTLTAGSITSSGSIVPNTYSIYTLASSSSAPLPVTLVSFDASLNDASNTSLQWRTTSEQNSQKFNVEHSIDGKVWVEKGSVEAVGESSSSVDYSFIDVTPVIGENLYRLKMIDKDGTFAYSRIESVRLEGVAAVFYPNPVADRLFLKISDKAPVTGIALRNAAGNSVFSASSIPANGIDVKSLDAGIYLIQVILENGQYRTQKILVTK
ncbi:T9SS type A sorting domain-containing protein [Dyadobacter sp. CY345]|uniref:T9SS type A sorting domain-containing protein n=1 Tax=Dyadobacter sp. CY345 TaxID=2909335 RepID=UPI001F41DB17|nr:T9SS type A sorting domain-containing protein [Dyadobacter sp. CY345]MCF2446469.1 T9SS type A sorting domain-containing protein [Dyadobacter sp. CY345]